MCRHFPHITLANVSFIQATFPYKSKLALVSLLLQKPGLPKSYLVNFRPIFHLNAIGKILERLALIHFLPHFSKSPSFSPLQSCFHFFHILDDSSLLFFLQCLESWEEVIPKIQKTDLEVDDQTQTSPK